MVADRGTREAPVYSPVLGEIVCSVECLASASDSSTW